MKESEWSVALKVAQISKGLCYVPIICILVMMSFSSTDSLKRNVDTLPAIVVSTLEKWLSKKLKEKFQIKNIAF